MKVGVVPPWIELQPGHLSWWMKVSKEEGQESNEKQSLGFVVTGKCINPFFITIPKSLRQANFMEKKGLLSSQIWRPERSRSGSPIG